MRNQITPANLKKFNKILGEGMKKTLEERGWVFLYSEKETVLKKIPDKSTLRSQVEIKPHFDNLHIYYSLYHPFDGELKKESNISEGPYSAVKYINRLMSHVLEPSLTGDSGTKEYRIIFKKYKIK